MFPFDVSTLLLGLLIFSGVVVYLKGIRVGSRIKYHKDRLIKLGRIQQIYGQIINGLSKYEHFNG